MKKLFTLFSAIAVAITMYAVPAPTNVHWEGTTLKWELPELTNDSVYNNEYLTLYNAEGAELLASGGHLDGEYDCSSYFFHGRTYYAVVQTDANPGGVYSAKVTSPNYVDPNPKDTLEIPNVQLSTEGVVSWTSYSYMFVRATLQKKNAGVWEDVATKTTTWGWASSVSFDNITVAGTYRAIADGLQGTDVVKRGISAELEIEEPFTVSFNAQSLFANPDAALIPNNAKVSAPSIPNDFRNHHDGYLFYWSTDAAGNTPWSFEDDVVTGDMTLYAQWKEWPALNPVWDVDTCKWTMQAGFGKMLDNLSVTVFSEKDDYVIGSGYSDHDADYFFGNEFFPGRKYSCEIELKDYYNNYVVAKSALHTISGEATAFPLTNMTVADPATARITWDNPRYTIYKKVGSIDRWNKGTGEWDEVTTHEDGSANWNHYGMTFDVALDAEEYYRIQCELHQAEYIVYAGEIFYGTNPATALDNANANANAVKRIVNGMLLIERGNRTYTLTGQAVK